MALDVEDVTLLGVGTTPDLAMAAAEADSGKPLTWIERADGRFTSGDRDYPAYRVQPVEVAE